MPSIIKAGNATAGVQVSSDNTGTLDLRTGTGAGTTAISINASQVVTMPGNLVVTGSITTGGVPAGGNYALNAYTSPTTWSKPAGLKAVKVTVVGAGGNGASTPSVTNTTSGGGGGGAAIEYIPAPSIPGPVAVTAGPGTNSFGGFCSATAGANAVFPSSTPFAGGTGAGGTLNFTGGYSSALSNIQAGGASFLASPIIGGTISPSPTSSSTGFNGLNYGGGGSGAPGTGTAGPKVGGTGAPGIVIVEEFY